MKLEDLERDILGAYLNYENNDLKTAVKQLDMSANSLLKDDKTLDPVWTSISKNVYISVILNNFSKGKEFSLKDLESMLNNQTLVYNNIIEFCNKFENSDEISFATTLKKISENPLKSAIQILKENIEKINNLSVATLDNNIASAENKTEKITQCDILEIVDKKAKETKTYNIKTNVRNVVTKMDISYLQDGKEIQEERIIFDFDIIDVNDNFITIKTNPMCEVKDGKINLNNPKTEFTLYKDLELTLTTPTMDGGHTYKLLIKKGNIDSTKELIDYAEKYDNFLEENKVLTFLKTLTTDEIKNIIFYVIDSHFVATNLVKLIINNYGVEIMPKNLKWKEKNYDEFDYIEAGMYAFLCREWSSANSYAKEKAKKYEELIVFLKNKGFNSDLTLSFTGDGYHSGEKYDYTDTFNKITKNQGNKETLSSNELTKLLQDVHGNESINTKNNEFNLEKNIENVFEIWNEIKNKNLELKDFFEETENEAIKELNYAKDKATIKSKKLSEYLKDDNATCSDKNIQLLISYFGFQSLYDMKFTNDGNIPCEEISIDNVGLFRAVLIINIISKLDSIFSIGIPLNIKFTFERKEFAEILSPMLNYYLTKIFNNINEIKIFYK